jgi:hypothetical protein
MAQQVRARKQVTVQYSTNNKQTESLSRGFVYRELYLRLQGAPTLTNANNTLANTRRGDEWQVVKRIEIVANGVDLIRTIDGNSLWWMNLLWYGMMPHVTFTLGDGATANPAFDSILILPFWLPQSVHPIDTALNSGELSSLEIAVTWGTFTDVNSAATAWTTNPTLEVYSLESFGMTGPFSQFRQWVIQRDINASNPRLQIDLPVGNMFRGFLINFTNGTTGNPALDTDTGTTILNNFKLISGTTVFADLQRTALFDGGYLRKSVSRVFTGAAGGTYTADRRGTPNDRSGWFLYDHVTDGFVSEAIDTLGFSEFKVELDVTKPANTTTLFLYPLEIIPVRQAA